MQLCLQKATLLHNEYLGEIGSVITELDHHDVT